MEDKIAYNLISETALKLSVRTQELNFKLNQDSLLFLELSCNGALSRTQAEAVKPSKDSLHLSGFGELSFIAKWNVSRNSYDSALLELSVMQDTSDQISRLGTAVFQLSTLLNAKILSSVVRLKLDKCTQPNSHLTLCFSVDKVIEEGFMTSRSSISTTQSVRASESRDLPRISFSTKESFLDKTANRFMYHSRSLLPKDFTRSTKHVSSFSRNKATKNIGLKVTEGFKEKPLPVKRVTLPALLIHTDLMTPSSSEIDSSISFMKPIIEEARSNVIQTVEVPPPFDYLITPQKTQKNQKTLIDCQPKASGYFSRRSARKNLSDRLGIHPLGNAFSKPSITKSLIINEGERSEVSLPKISLNVDNVFSFAQQRKEQSHSLSVKHPRGSALAGDLKKKEKEIEYLLGHIRFLKEELEDMRTQKQTRDLTIISSEIQRRKLAEECEYLQKQLTDSRESFAEKANKMSLVVNTVFDMQEAPRRQELFDKIEQILAEKDSA